MARLPTPCEVLDPPSNSWVPLVKAAGNIYILPGIPRLFQSMIENQADMLRGPKHVSKEVLTQMGEGDIAATLADIAAKHPGIRIGSYPNTDWDMNRGDGQDLPFRVKIALEGRDETEVLETADEIIDKCKGFMR